MSIFRCKMCGGSLNVQQGSTVCECEYCGTKQTVSATTDEVTTNLYNRANNLRIKCEFDKAQETYEKIIANNANDAEAYWGIVLCKYGIEYVEDPTTATRVPTCHRTQLESVLTDVDYLSAVNNADNEQKIIYEQEARAIDKLQKDILSIVRNEKPFDVFICYKETDENGKRTVDSTLANDIYYQLTQEGLKVFYAAITLENKLGQEYEPYIFAALNSAKVMLVVGTKPEYFDAVWVKNEWSRFLKLMKTDREKTLIPCFRDMDAYDLPDEFSHLQSQDMSKIGFVNDLVRGINKIVKNEPEQVNDNFSANPSGSNINTFLKRVSMFLEDKNWKGADEYCEKVLDIDPECAEAYLGKLMAELQVSKQENLADSEDSFEENNNYQNAIRFSDEELKTVLVGYIKHINIRNESARKEAERIAKRNKKIAIITTPIVCAVIAFIIVLNAVIIPNSKYNKAQELYNSGKYSEAIAAFEKLNDYRDSADKLKQCNYLYAIELKDSGNIVEAYEALIALDGYKDSTDKANSIYGKYEVEKLKSAKVGEYVNFGAYEKDNNAQNGKENVEWLVLEVKDGKALLISKYGLDCKPYNTSLTDVTWETCTLRKWLNDDFINAAFSADEKAMIPTVTVSADKNPGYSTYLGNATQDQVFLLSITEANEYLDSDSARQCKPTDYTVANGAYEGDGGICWWWMRSPGGSQTAAADVLIGGDVNEFGNHVSVDYIAVRPALWISIN